MNWLSYADARVSGLLEEVERKPADDVISMADATEEVKALSTKLYSAERVSAAVGRLELTGMVSDYGRCC